MMHLYFKENMWSVKQNKHSKQKSGKKVKGKAGGGLGYNLGPEGEMDRS